MSVVKETRVKPLFSFACYKFEVVENGLKHLKKIITDHEQNIIVLADKHTYAFCYPLLETNVPHIIVPYGENYKNLNSCEFIWKKLIELNAKRNTTLLCLGGGVLCDMGAFAGKCYQRGMSVVLAPTSLLAMVDASIGGKNGVDFLGLKNYIGTFSEPKHIFICPEFLTTLPYPEMVNGFVEMLKHGLIASKSHYDKVKLFFLKDNHAITPNLINDSIAIKTQIVKDDFLDLGVRRRLNFGHTIGHAIEANSLKISEENEALSHGISVALGMVVECYISHKVVGFSADQLSEVSTVLSGLVKSVYDEIPEVDDLIPYLTRDKKNFNDSINCTLLLEIGEANHDYEIGEELIKAGFEYLKSLK